MKYWQCLLEIGKMIKCFDVSMTKCPCPPMVDTECEDCATNEGQGWQDCQLQQRNVPAVKYLQKAGIAERMGIQDPCVSALYMGKFVRSLKVKVNQSAQKKLFFCVRVVFLQVRRFSRYTYI